MAQARALGLPALLGPAGRARDLALALIVSRVQILSLLDLRAILQAPAGGPTDLSWIVVLGEDTPEFGLLAERADSIVTMDRRDILPPPAVMAGSGREYVRGVTARALVVLDGSRLLHDPRLFVDQRDMAADG
jgi:chemotaxis signal transduction protein